MINQNSFDIMIHGYRLMRTCGACPEQYDVLDSQENVVAYLRLRHGSYTVSVPDVGGKVIYQAFPQGDGIFEDHERVKYLEESIKNIQRYYINREWVRDEQTN
jgi:hypothetical protein